MDPIVIIHNQNRNLKNEVNTGEDMSQDQSRLKLDSILPGIFTLIDSFI